MPFFFALVPLVAAVLFIAGYIDAPLVSAIDDDIASVAAAQNKARPRLRESEVFSLQPILQGRYAKIASSEAFELKKGQTFLISFAFRLSSLPPIGHRQKIISKFLGSKSPYSGWAIAIHHLRTSMRPEVYWRGRKGRGGWLSFEKVFLQPERWYAITLFVQAGEFMSLYLEDLARVSDELLSPSASPAAFPLEASQGRSESRVVFLGGHDIRNIGTPNTSAPLYIGSPKTGASAFQGEIAHLLIGYPKEFSTSIGELRKTLRGGPVQIVSQLESGEVSLLVREPGKDSSRFAHQIEDPNASS